MAVVNGYATVQEIRDQLGDAGSKLPLALLEKAINATSRAIDKHCERRFWQDQTIKVRTYRPHDPCRAWVDEISTLAGLVVKTDTAGDGTWATTWAAGDFQLEPLNADQADPAYAWWRISAIGAQRFPRPVSGRPTLQVTAKFGWAQVPDEVNGAAILRAVKLFRRKESPEGWTGFSEFGPVRISRFEDPDVVALLAPYIRYAPPDR